MILIFMASLCLSSCNKPKETTPWDTYTSKDKLFKISYPHDWKSSLDGHTYNITPPDATGLVAATDYVDPGPVFDENAFKDMVMLDFSECHVKEPFAPVTQLQWAADKPSNAPVSQIQWGGEKAPFAFVKQLKWVGEDAVYERTVNGQKIIYLFRVAHLGQVGVFVAASEIEAHMASRKPIYRKIMDSLVIYDAALVDKQSKEGVAAGGKKLPWQEYAIDFLKWLQEQASSFLGWVQEKVADLLRSTESEKDKVESGTDNKTEVKNSPGVSKDKRSYFGY
jgi:hypothetical protein